MPCSSGYSFIFREPIVTVQNQKSSGFPAQLRKYLNCKRLQLGGECLPAGRSWLAVPAPSGQPALLGHCPGISRDCRDFGAHVDRALRVFQAVTGEHADYDRRFGSVVKEALAHEIA